MMAYLRRQKKHRYMVIALCVDSPEYYLWQCLRRWDEIGHFIVSIKLKLILKGLEKTRGPSGYLLYM